MIKGRVQIEKAIAGRIRDPHIRSDIAFHMLDWVGDLKRWNRFIEKPNAFSPQELESLLIEFLVHVPNHVVAARKLLLGEAIRDIFDLNIFEDEYNNSADE